MKDDDFSQRFALLCQARGLTSRVLARTVGVDESMTSRWLRGETTPRNRAHVLERALGMSIGEFYSLDLDKLRHEVLEAPAP